MNKHLYKKCTIDTPKTYICMHVPIKYINILMYSICVLRAGAESACFTIILLWRNNIRTYVLSILLTYTDQLNQLWALTTACVLGAQCDTKIYSTIAFM